jgi:hypothetical protein
MQAENRQLRNYRFYVKAMLAEVSNQQWFDIVMPST